MARYTIDGVEYPSVTELTGQLDKSAALMPWAVNNACKYVWDNLPDESTPETLNNCLDMAKREYKNVSAEACDIGSEVHEKIEMYIKHGRDACGDMRPEVEHAFLAFLEWETENVDEWLESEMVVVSEQHGYAGTLDAIVKLKDGHIYCIDFKSSKGFYDGYAMQLSAYIQARNAMNGEYAINTLHSVYKASYEPTNVIRGGVLRLDKITGQPEWKDYTKVLTQKTVAFNMLVSFYYHWKNRRLKNNMIAKNVKEFYKSADK